MIKRIFWVAVGATGAFLVMRYVARSVETYSPAGIARATADLGHAVRDFGRDVRHAMDQREQELRHTLFESEPSGD